MKIITPSYKIIRGLNSDVLPFIEECGRTCYKSEDKITPTSASRFVKNLVEKEHESVIEHAHVTVRIVASRSLTHQLVRHRLASYSQESQRYVNYCKGKFEGVSYIDPMFKVNGTRFTYDDYLRIVNKPIVCNTEEEKKVIQFYINFENQCKAAEESYFELISDGAPPEDARSVLPGCCKTEIVVTANLRVWRHIFKERAINNHAQYEIRTIMSSLLDDFKTVLPEIFGDLGENNA